MFGYLRFFLASLVLISHSGIYLQGFNQGVSAVVLFYMLAGFVVCGLLSKVFVAERSMLFQFYYERILRIFPAYLFFALLTLFFILLTHYGTPKVSLVTLLNNIIIIPLNYYMVLDNSILQDPKWWLIPPAWSLGLELQAYILLPFAIYYKPVRAILAVASFSIFCLANLNIIHTDYFGYRLLPGVLFVFILGVSIFNNTTTQISTSLFDKYFPAISYISVLILLIYLGILNRLTYPYVRETMLGILIGMPIIIYIANCNIKLPCNHFIGDLSYSLFLSHFLVMWVIQHYALIDKSEHPCLFVVMVFLIALLLSTVCVILVERNIKKYRYNLYKSRKN